MSDQRPDKAEPPYPGWSAEQPPERPAAQGQHDQGWQSPAAPGSAGQGEQRPGWGPPSAPSSGGPSSGQAQGWGSQTQWAWAQPKVKPGVIPLRPLGVGEILDGAVTTIRKNLGAMLGLSVVVAAIIQLGGLYFNWAIYDSMSRIATLPATPTDDQVLGIFSDLIPATLLYSLLDWVGRTILTGILTVVVSRAVLGEHMTAGDAWRRARPRLLRLLGLTILYSLIAAGPILAAALITAGLAFAETGGASLGALLVIAALPVSIWLAIRYVLAAPIIMIETVQPSNGAAAPIGIIESLRRSAELVRNSWWRALGIYLLIWLIAIMVAQAMSFTVSLPATFADPAEGIGFGSVLLLSLGGLLATTVTAPFVAGAVALLYVDRRIRAEGLDIELARAAGVTIPGRTDTPPGAGSGTGPAPG